MGKKIISFSKKVKQFFKNNRMDIFISIIIFISLIVTRFIRLGDTAFFVNDQGRDIKVLYNMLINGKMTLIGPATSFSG